MMKTVRFSLRMKESTNEMLERLVRDDQEEASRLNRAPMNRSEMIETCIIEYYAARHDGNLHNAYLEMVTATLTPLLQQAVNRILREIAETNENTETRIDKYGLTIQQQLKLMILSPQFADDENMVRFYLASNAAYEKVIDEITDRIIEEGGK